MSIHCYCLRLFSCYSGKMEYLPETIWPTKPKAHYYVTLYQEKFATLMNPTVFRGMPHPDSYEEKTWEKHCP